MAIWNSDITERELTVPPTNGWIKKQDKKVYSKVYHKRHMPGKDTHRHVCHYSLLTYGWVRGNNKDNHYHQYTQIVYYYLG